MGVSDFSPDLFEQLDKGWNTLITEWQAQNRKVFFKRDYSHLQKIAIQTKRLATEAGGKANTVKDSLYRCASIEISTLENTISRLNMANQSLPDYVADSFYLIKAELLLSESREAFKRGEYKQALMLVNSAASKINQTEETVRYKVGQYQKQLLIWKQWVDDAITYSCEYQCPVIVVDKFAHFCYLYESGILIYKYQAEFGPNWMGHKRRRGDRATPEGRYFVNEKKDTSKSRYYKALELNYPNAEDQQVFETAKQKGSLPANAEIGGLIEIHGDGGKGDDWTNGCIALRNDDMERLYQRVSEGTPVTIVGSINKINLTRR